jgi:membrane dipeptidase
MKFLFALFLTLAPFAISAQESPAARVARILKTVPLVDGHNDLPGAIRAAATDHADISAYNLRESLSGNTDLARLSTGLVGAQLWSVHVPSEAANPARQQLEQIDIAHRMIAAYPDALGFAASASDVERVFGEGRIASLLGIEGGHVIENSLGALRAFYALGVRYMTLTHFLNTDWADSATDEPVLGGLSDLGEDIVREMNHMGMLVDLSHVSPGTMSDALDVAEAPVIFSHSGSRAMADHVRNVPDSILARLPENGGIVMQVFYPLYVSPAVLAHAARATEFEAQLRTRLGDDENRIQRELTGWQSANPVPTSPISDVADHLDHIVEVAGIDHVGLGSDFDGIPTYHEGLEDVSTFPALFIELVNRGWSDDSLRKLAGENILSVMREAEASARRLQRLRPPKPGLPR